MPAKGQLCKQAFLRTSIWAFYVDFCTLFYRDDITRPWANFSSPVVPGSTLPKLTYFIEPHNKLVQGQAGMGPLTDK